jgi:hypothetical protein
VKIKKREKKRKKKKKSLSLPNQTTIRNTHRLIQLKLLGEVFRYNLYYFLTHSFKWKPFRLETCIDSYYLLLNFYQINRDGEIRTRDRLVIKTMIQYQKFNSTQNFKLLGKTPNIIYSKSICLMNVTLELFQIHKFHNVVLIVRHYFKNWRGIKL